MKKLFVRGFVFFSLVFAVNGFTATSQRIGVINVQEVLQSSPKLMTQLNQLKKEFKNRDEEILTLQKSIEADNKKISRDAAVMSESERDKLQDKIFAERNNLRLKQEQFRRDVAKKQQDAMQKVLGQLKVAISKVATQEGFDLVLQREGLPFASTSLDISDEVKKALNQKS